MLHEVYVEAFEWTKCLCKCYMKFVWWIIEEILSEQHVYVNVTCSLCDELKKRFGEQNVYVNVTCSLCERYLVVEAFEWTKCLCECYMKFVQKHLSEQNVCVNVTWSLCDEL
jgi:hypothetical protein